MKELKDIFNAFEEDIIFHLTTIKGKEVVNQFSELLSECLYNTSSNLRIKSLQLEEIADKCDDVCYILKLKNKVKDADDFPFDPEDFVNAASDWWDSDRKWIDPNDEWLKKNVYGERKEVEPEVNELKNEPIVIKDIPVKYQDQEFNEYNLIKLLEILKEKYSIILSYDGDKDKIINLDLDEDLGINSMDIKLFLPFMLVNKINEERKPNEIAFIYQSDYNYFEDISNRGKLGDLLNMYTILASRTRSSFGANKDKGIPKEVYDQAVE